MGVWTWAMRLGRCREVGERTTGNGERTTGNRTLTKGVGAVAARASEALTSDFCPLSLWPDDSKARPRGQERYLWLVVRQFHRKSFTVRTNLMSS